MKIYLDNCSFNRPFDDRSSMRIKLETEAKLFVQEKILIGKLQLIWSHILEYENMQNPFVERRNAIIEWKKIAAEKIGGTENVVARASEFTRHGVKSKDALHIACAIEGKAEYFLTTDDKLLKKLAKTKELIVINPVNFIPILESM
ncbi:MAG: PIN domain-containing protein [Deltaproteobacteria bacterium]|nr:PIN domain-containing protein [Deltaproteobacteria bacterium]